MSCIYRADLAHRPLIICVTHNPAAVQYTSVCSCTLFAKFLDGYCSRRRKSKLGEALVFQSSKKEIDILNFKLRLSWPWQVTIIVKLAHRVDGC